jgi:hypothetical protein
VPLDHAQPAAGHAMADATDPTQLLDVQMDQLAGRCRS